MRGVPQTWYGRLFAAIVSVLLLWLALIFLTVFLIIVGFVVAVVIARLLWHFKKTAKRQPSSFIETTYFVENTKQTEPQNAKHKNES